MSTPTTAGRSAPPGSGRPVRRTLADHLTVFGLPADPDVTGRRMSTPLALLIILGAYGCFFGRSIIRAFQIEGTKAAPDDYGSTDFIAATGRWAGEIALAIALLVIVRSFVLTVPWSAAGFPPRRSSVWPTTATVILAAVGLALSAAVKAALDGGVNASAAGGTAGNAWAAFGILRSLNAGVVEEITMVALPVLLLRRAGWHPAAIVALSVGMRWPFHIYHGLWSSLPWAAIWGGLFCLAFLYLRRLVPLIIFHAMYDTTLITSQAWGAWALMACIAVVLALLVWLGARLLRERLDRLDARSLRPSPRTGFYLLRHDSGAQVMYGFFIVPIVLCAVVAIEVAPIEPETAWATGVIAVLLIGVLWAQGVSIAARVAATARRDHRGRITGAVSWAAMSYPGYVRVMSWHRTDPLDAVRIVAEHEPSATHICASVASKNAALFAGAGYPRTRLPLSLNRAVVIPREAALTMGSAAPVPVDA
jgi:hypothetical protein